MIGATYGHLAQDAEDQDRDLLDAFDGHNGASGHAVGTTRRNGTRATAPRSTKTPWREGVSV
jgi:hypothetical protein